MVLCILCWSHGYHDLALDENMKVRLPISNSKKTSKKHTLASPCRKYLTASYSTALVECAWCRKTLYCSSVCQKQDRQAHKQARGIRSLNMKFALSLPVLHWKRNSTFIAFHSHSHCFILIVILIACDSVRSLSLLVMIGSLIQSLRHCLSSFLQYEIVCRCT